MAGIRITELNSGGNVTSTDQLPIARDGTITLRIPASQFVTNASNVGSGTGLLFSDKSTAAGSTLNFRTIRVENNLSLLTQGNTITISASGQDPTKTAFYGNGVTTTWSLNGANSSNPNNYRVTIDGVTQEPLVDFLISVPNIIFTSPPPNLSRVVVISNNLVNVYSNAPSDNTVTPSKLSLGGPSWDAAGNVYIAGATQNATTGAGIYIPLSWGIQSTGDTNNLYIAGGSTYTKGGQINLYGPTSSGAGCISFATGSGTTNTNRLTITGAGIIDAYNNPIINCPTVVPTGAVMAFAMNSAPAGWLAADGTAVSRTTYASLFATIGIIHGAGDGTTTFNLPDLRGYFVRGVGTNVDGTASAAFGVKQQDAIRNLSGVIGSVITWITASGVFSFGATRPLTAGGGGLGTRDVDMDASRQVPTANENRPKNIALLYCIKT